jgi:uncharacterized membrane protein YecN with MAPEG domain
MGRNLYILGAALGVLAILSAALSFTSVAQSPGDVSLWRTSGIVLCFMALVVTLLGILSSLFDQAERRANEERIKRKQQRRRE